MGQRVRWARGMIQILRTDNPLTAKGLKWPQRLCYVNAMIHFLYAGPRLVFLTAPLIFMLLGRINIPGFWAEILVYSAPHLFLANLTNFRVQSRYRYSFWNEVYETVLAPYILWPTLMALVNPKLGKFNVTAKGGLVKKSYFDLVIARPYVFLILLNMLGLVVAVIRFFWSNPHQPGTIAMNVVWILFNTVILGTANAAAYEAKQMRADVRVDVRKPVAIRLPNGNHIAGETADISLGGAHVALNENIGVPVGTAIHIVFPQRDGDVILPAQVVVANGSSLRLKYAPLSMEQREQLTLVLYTDADAWLARIEHRKMDQPMKSFLRLVSLSVRGVWWALTGWIPSRAAAASLVALFVLLAGAAGLRGQARPRSQTAEPASVSVPALAQQADAGKGVFHTTFQLKDVGVPGAITFRGVDSAQNIRFSLSHTVVVQKATLKLHYSFSPSLIASLSHLNVFLNDTLIATLPVPQNAAQVQKALDAEIPLPAEMVVHDNVLKFQFVGHYTMQCEDPSNSTLWGRVENTSSIELNGALLEIPNNLDILPFPFYDGSIGSETGVIPMMFVSTPSKQALDAAGVVASWFGVQVKSKPLRFPVQVGGSLPAGNVVLFVENPQSMPAVDNVQSQISGPTLAMRSNPNDPFGEVLVVAGADSGQLLTAAQALASGGAVVQGDTARIGHLDLPLSAQG